MHSNLIKDPDSFSTISNSFLENLSGSLVRVLCTPYRVVTGLPGEELTHSKYKSGTTHFECYMTVQCVNDKMRTVLAASYLKKLESIPDYVDIVLKIMAETDIRIHQKLKMYPLSKFFAHNFTS